jgi:hypothetical protein
MNALKKLPWYLLPIGWGIIFVPLIILIGETWKLLSPDDFQSLDGWGLDTIGPAVIATVVALIAVLAGSFITTKTNKSLSLIITLTVSIITFVLQGLLGK